MKLLAGFEPHGDDGEEAGRGGGWYCWLSKSCILMDLGVENGGHPNLTRWTGQGIGGGGVLEGTEILERLMGTGRENGRHPNLRRQVDCAGKRGWGHCHVGHRHPRR